MMLYISSYLNFQYVRYAEVHCTMPRKKKKKEPELTPEELKQKIAECEERYHNSFKTNLCKEIMSSWHALCAAKEKYYKSIKREVPADESTQITGNSDQIIDDFDLD